jgi:hypothetical protein
MTTNRSAKAVLLLWLLHTSSAVAADRYAVVITGASAGELYALKYDEWRKAFTTTLKQKLGYPDDHVIILAESEHSDVSRPTRDNVRHTFTELRDRVSTDDLVFVLLIGHGTVDEDEAKFNLVGPDLSASEWASLLKPLKARLVFVDTTGGSFPFLRRLAGPGRIVITATDSDAQQFETVFPEFFVRSFDEPSADADKNGRVSIWEAFSFASAAVRRTFDQRGQLPTERALLDDDGDGVGREARNPGADGSVARGVFLGPESAPALADNELVKQRAELERRLDDLRLRKVSSTDPARFDAEIQELLIEIARLSRQIKSQP